MSRLLQTVHPDVVTMTIGSDGFGADSDEVNRGPGAGWSSSCIRRGDGARGPRTNGMAGCDGKSLGEQARPESSREESRRSFPNSSDFPASSAGTAPETLQM